MICAYMDTNSAISWTTNREPASHLSTNPCYVCWILIFDYIYIEQVLTVQYILLNKWRLKTVVSASICLLGAFWDVLVAVTSLHDTKFKNKLKLHVSMQLHDHGRQLQLLILRLHHYHACNLFISVEMNKRGLWFTHYVLSQYFDISCVPLT